MPYNAEYYRTWREKNSTDIQNRKKMWDKENNARVVEKQRLRARMNKAALIEYKGGHCQDCEKIYPQCCYDFDHLRDKIFTIGEKLAKLSLEKLKEEADKCDLVCANCHRIRTQNRFEGVVLEQEACGQRGESTPNFK